MSEKFANIGKNDIPYGIAQANYLPELVDEIVNNGRDLFYEEQHEELKNRLKNCDSIETFNSILEEYNSEKEFDWVETEEDLTEFKEDLENEDLSIILSNVMMDNEKQSFLYEKDGFTLTYDGEHICVMDSPFLFHCRPCSPCFPNAGDLDTLTESGYGLVVYGYDPEYIPEDMKDKIQIVENEISLINEE